MFVLHFFASFVQVLNGAHQCAHALVLLSYLTMHGCLDIDQVTIFLTLVIDAHIALVPIPEVTTSHRILVVHFSLVVFEL